MNLLQTVRDWRRLRRRGRKRLSKLATADAVFLSPAKSGRTWVRVMLSHLYHQRHGTPLDELIDHDNFKRLVPGIPDLFFTHDINEPPALRRQLSGRALAKSKFIHMVRDPRDVAISRYYQFAFRHSEEQRRRRGIERSMDDIPLFEFVADEQHGLPVVIDSMNRWAKEAAVIRDCLTMRYEDLHRATELELGRLAAFLGENPSPEQLAAAVEFARFDSLKKREAAGFFKQSIMQPGLAGDARSFKVRRGKVGGYREDFDREQVAILDRIVDERLVDGYGYKSKEMAPIKPDSLAS